MGNKRILFLRFDTPTLSEGSNLPRMRSRSNQRRWQTLPAPVRSEWCRVGSSEPAAAPTPTASPTVMTAAASAVAGHLIQTRINLLFRLVEDGDEVPGLLGIW